MWLRIFALFLILTPSAFAGERPSNSVEQGDKSAEWEGYRLGANFPDYESVKDLPTVKLTRSFSPEAVDMTDRFPPPGDQGNVGACVAWAVGYAARSSIAHQETGSDVTDPVDTVSPEWLYQKIYDKKSPSCEDAGADIRRAMRYIKNHGAASIKDAPLMNACSPKAVRVASAQLSRFRIKGVKLLAWEPRPPYTPSMGRRRIRIHIGKIKSELASGYPVVFGMQVSARFKKLQGSLVYEGTALTLPKKLVGGHAMVILGYDDRKQAFRVQNSWGRTWADGGRGWISYDSFKSDVTSAFVMVPDKPPSRPLPGRSGKSRSWFADELKLQCADLSVSKAGSGKVKVFGYVASERDRHRVNEEISKRGWSGKIEMHPWPVCEALETLRQPLSATSKPEISTLSKARKFKLGERFSFEVKAPDFPSFFYLFYLQADGTVVNLAPRQGIIREQTPPGTVLHFGDGKNGRPRFRATKPVGEETVIAIASRSPIEELERFEKKGEVYYRMLLVKSDSEEGPADRRFLSRLRAALLSRPDPAALPREMSASVLHLTITE